MNKIEKLDEFLQEKVNDLVSPGFTYGIVTKEDNYLGSVGYSQIYPFKQLAQEQQLYDISSLTKVIVTVTIMLKLYENKVISLSDPVSKYLPNFKYDDITLFNLLVHNSGLPADLDSKEIVSKNTILENLYTQEKVYETESNVLYSDLGYMFLGIIIEKIYGMPLNEVAKNEIFIPLEMENTQFNPLNKDNCVPTEIDPKRGIVKGIVHDEKACSMGGVSGNAGVFTTASDLMNYVSMILNDGIYKSKQYLKKETIDLLFENLVYEPSLNRTRSFCWITNNNDLVIKNRNNVISFTGFTGPSISIDRDNNVGVVLLTNRIHPSRDNRKLSTQRSDIYDKVYETLNIGKIKTI